MKEIELDETLGNALSISSNRVINARQSLNPSWIDLSYVKDLKDYTYKNLKEYIKYSFLHERILNEIKFKYDLFDKNFSILSSSCIQVK